MKSRIPTPSTLLLVVHIKAAMTGTHGAAIDSHSLIIIMTNPNPDHFGALPRTNKVHPEITILQIQSTGKRFFFQNPLTNQNLCSNIVAR